MHVVQALVALNVGGSELVATELAEYLAANGHEVTVITGQQNYRTGSSEAASLRPRVETVDGVRVVRTYVYSAYRGSFKKRYLNFGSFLVSSVAAALGELLGTIRELITSQYGNQFYKMTVPGAWIGKPVGEVFGLGAEHGTRDDLPVVCGFELEAAQMRIAPHQHDLLYRKRKIQRRNLRDLCDHLRHCARRIARQRRTPFLRRR